MVESVIPYFCASSPITSLSSWNFGFPRKTPELKNDFFPHRRGHVDRLGETALAGALPIDIRMIKKVAAQFQRGIQQRLCLLLLYIADSPTSYRNRRHQNTAFL